MLKADPAQSDRSIAAAAGATHPTVGRIRRDLERTGQLTSVAVRRTADGKRRGVEVVDVDASWREGGLGWHVLRLTGGQS